MGPGLTYLSVRNWGRYQHYKHRRPPWVKLYTDMLHDEELRGLSHTTRLLWVLLLLLSGEFANAIPNDSERIAAWTGIPAAACREGIETLLKGRWLSEKQTKRSASKSASKPASKSASATAPTETERETETETETERKAAPASDRAEKVVSLLSRLGKPVDVRRIETLMAAYPDRDHVGEAGRAVAWDQGRSEDKRWRDVAKAYGNWLANADPARPARDGSNYPDLTAENPA